MSKLKSWGINAKRNRLTKKDYGFWFLVGFLLTGVSYFAFMAGVSTALASTQEISMSGITDYVVDPMDIDKSSKRLTQLMKGA